MLDIYLDPGIIEPYQDERYQMTYTVQELALQYAEKLVAFHEAMQSGTHAQERELRVARNEMFDAQNALNEAAKREAELLA